MLKDRNSVIEKLLFQIDIPPRFLAKSFDNYDCKGELVAGIKKAQKACDDLLGGIFFYGKTNTGKTHLLTACARHIILTHESIKAKHIRFFDARDFLIDMRESYSTRTSERMIYEKYLKYKVLLLDDFAADSQNEHFRDKWGKLINDIYNRNNMFLVMTSNYNLSQISQHIDSRIARRINDICSLKIGLK